MLVRLIGDSVQRESFGIAAAVPASHLSADPGRKSLTPPLPPRLGQFVKLIDRKYVTSNDIAIPADLLGRKE